MYFSGINCVVKLYGGPYSTPILSAKFQFPITKLEVVIDQGVLSYMTSDGTDSMGVHGFCMDKGATQAIGTAAAFKTRDTCLDNNNTPGVEFEWIPFLKASTATNIEEIQLSHHHLELALDEMMEYYKGAYIQQQDFDALSEWVVEIEAKIQDNATANITGAKSSRFNPYTKLQNSVDIQQSRVLDAIAISFSIEQSSTPIYTPGSQLMEAQMRGNTMIQGSVTLNFDSYDIMDLINHTNIMHLEIFYFKDELEKDEFLINSSYQAISETRSYILQDIRFISKQHATSPAPENITENIQFIAKALTYDNPI